jgi:hypothetical protein
MILQFLTSTAMIVHLAGAVQILGLLMRNQIWLRVLVLSGDALYFTFYYVHPPAPLYDAMVWSAAMVIANLAMVAIIIHDRRSHGITDEALHVYGAFGGMVPGDFRRLMRPARIRRNDAPVVLTRLDEVPGRLFFVIDGPLTVERRDRTLRFPANGLFIAEIGFLLGTPASATVTIGPGGRFVEWERGALMALFERSPTIRHAVERALSRDLAHKLARDAAAAGPEP